MAIRGKPIPLCVLFIVVALLLSGAVIAATWTTLYSTMMSSVNDVASRLAYFIGADLKARLEATVNEMAMVVMEADALRNLRNDSAADIEQISWRLIKTFPRVESFAVAGSDGSITGGIRYNMRNNSIAVGSRPGSPLNAPLNFSYYQVDSLGNKGAMVETKPVRYDVSVKAEIDIISE